MKEKFLDYDLQVDYYESYKNLYRYILKNPDYCEQLRRLKYDVFLDTKYWEVLSAVIKMNAMRCECCGWTFEKYNQLVIHHMDYNIRGYEIFNRKQLFCICHGCHKGFHSDKSKWYYSRYLGTYNWRKERENIVA